MKLLTRYKHIFVITTVASVVQLTGCQNTSYLKSNNKPVETVYVQSVPQAATKPKKSNEDAQVNIGVYVDPNDQQAFNQQDMLQTPDAQNNSQWQDLDNNKVLVTDLISDDAPINEPQAQQEPAPLNDQESTVTDELEETEQKQPGFSFNKSKNTGNSSLPAFNKLMKTAVLQFKNGETYAAKQNLIQAQRIAPNSPAVYLYLSAISLKEANALQAISTAQKGIAVSRSIGYDKSLWQVIYKAANMTSDDELRERALQKIEELNAQ